MKREKITNKQAHTARLITYAWSNARGASESCFFFIRYLSAENWSRQILLFFCLKCRIFFGKNRRWFNFRSSSCGYHNKCDARSDVFVFCSDFFSLVFLCSGHLNGTNILRIRLIVITERNSHKSEASQNARKNEKLNFALICNRFLVASSGALSDHN